MPSVNHYSKCKFATIEVRARLSHTYSLVCVGALALHLHAILKVFSDQWETPDLRRWIRVQNY